MGQYVGWSICYERFNTRLFGFVYKCLYLFSLCQSWVMCVKSIPKLSMLFHPQLFGELHRICVGGICQKQCCVSDTFWFWTQWIQYIFEQWIRNIFLQLMSNSTDWQFDVTTMSLYCIWIGLNMSFKTIHIKVAVN